MKHRLPPLDGLKAFEAAARHLSFSLAADELYITKGAVSYQIRKLEEHLQCALFKRSVRQVYLTDGGQMLLQTTQSMFSELGETLKNLQENRQQAGVTVAATTYVASRWLSKHISAFNEKFPDITVLLQHTVNSADFNLSEVDLAIRWGPCTVKPERNRFGTIPMALYPALSPRIMERNGIDSNVKVAAQQLRDEPFTSMPLLCEDRKQDLWQEWIDSNPENAILNAIPIGLDNPRRIISDANVRVQAAIDGQGLILADELMINELNNGSLVIPFTNQLHGYGYEFLYSANGIQNSNTLALKNWLSNHAALLKTTQP